LRGGHESVPDRWLIVGETSPFRSSCSSHRSIDLPTMRQEIQLALDGSKEFLRTITNATRSIATESNRHPDSTGRLLSNRRRKEGWKWLSSGLQRAASSAGYVEMLNGYAARFCSTRCSRERCFSLTCSVETTLRPRSASCTSSCWIACSRSFLCP